MSTIRDIPDAASAVPCPACGTAVDVIPVTVIRPGDAALQGLFDGSLNRADCESCGASFVLDIPIVFRDDESRYIVYFMPLPNRADWQRAEAGMRDVTQRVFATADDLDPPDFRLAADREEFIEKIALHFRDLDDRVVEYIKYQLLHRDPQDAKLSAVRHRLLYDFSRDDDDNLTFFVFDRETSEFVAGTHIPRSDYDEIAELMLGDDGFRDELDALFPGYYVNADRLD